MTRLSRLSGIEGKVVLVTGAASRHGPGHRPPVRRRGGPRRRRRPRRRARVDAVVDEITRGTAAMRRDWVCDVSDPAADPPARRRGRRPASAASTSWSTTPAWRCSTSAFQDEDELRGRNWAATVAVNLTAHARLIRAALPHLQARAGRVVNIASTEAIVDDRPACRPTPRPRPASSGSTKSLAVELGRTGVTVNCICPGPIRTGMTAAIPEEAKETYARRRVPAAPLRRPGGGRPRHAVSMCCPRRASSTARSSRSTAA